jgi:hypothetical protein
MGITTARTSRFVRKLPRSLVTGNQQQKQIAERGRVPICEQTIESRKHVWIQERTTSMACKTTSRVCPLPHRTTISSTVSPGTDESLNNDSICTSRACDPAAPEASPPPGTPSMSSSKSSIILSISVAASPLASRPGLPPDAAVNLPWLPRAAFGCLAMVCFRIGWCTALAVAVRETVFGVARSLPQLSHGSLLAQSPGSVSSQ